MQVATSFNPLNYRTPFFMHPYCNNNYFSGNFDTIGYGHTEHQAPPHSPQLSFNEFSNTIDLFQNRSNGTTKLFGSRIFGNKRSTAENTLPSPISPVSPFQFSPFSLKNNDTTYSRKVFVGGLPPDIDELEICHAFSQFGNLCVDWPHKSETKAHFPPKGYCFIIFEDEQSVHNLMDSCLLEGGKYYLNISSPSVKDKKVQIRPWSNENADYLLDSSVLLDPRKTVFVGGVPRPLKARELAENFNRYFGGVCYAGVDTDAELKYPKGAGRVAFSNYQSYVAAIAARFIELKTEDISKKVEVKPYVLDDQVCDWCHGSQGGSPYAPYFCANITCLQYYCEKCWKVAHSRGGGRECHKPMIKDTTERPKGCMGRWSMS